MSEGPPKDAKETSFADRCYWGAAAFCTAVFLWICFHAWLYMFSWAYKLSVLFHYLP